MIKIEREYKKKQSLNTKIEVFINSIPWVEQMGMVVTVEQGSIGFTGVEGKPFSCSERMINEIQGMITGIQYWEDRR